MKQAPRSSLPLIIAWTKGFRFKIFLLCFCNIAVALIAVFLSLVMKGLVDGATSHDFESLLWYAIVLAVFLLLQITLNFCSRQLEVRLQSGLTNHIRRDLLAEILKKEYSAVDGFHSGELVNRMFSDVTVVVTGIVTILPPLCGMLTHIIGAVALLLTLDIMFTLILLCVAALSFLIALLFRGKLKGLHKTVQKKEGAVHAVLQETLQNMRLIKASGSEKRMEKQVDTIQSDFRHAQVRRGTFTALAGFGLSFAFRASWFYAVIWGCIGIFNGMSYGTLIALMQLVGQVQAPMTNLSGILPKYYNTLSSAERLAELIDLPDEQVQETDDRGRGLYPLLSRIVLSDLSFSYGRTDVLTAVDLTFRPGDFTAITGLSGGGKSTLFLLLLGIYHPTSGTIAFETSEGTYAAGPQTRGMFAYVPQGNTLFSGTISDNLLLFCDGASDEEIRQALTASCLDDFIASLKDGLQTVIGERGIGLSEGQAQRLAVARAILSGAPILLLDEATSALDEATEAALLKNIGAMKQNKTCFIVTHRKAALSICDRVLQIEDGIVSDVTKANE